MNPLAIIILILAFGIFLALLVLIIFLAFAVRKILMSEKNLINETEQLFTI